MTTTVAKGQSSGPSGHAQARNGCCLFSCFGGGEPEVKPASQLPPDTCRSNTKSSYSKNRVLGNAGSPELGAPHPAPAPLDVATANATVLEEDAGTGGLDDQAQGTIYLDSQTTGYLTLYILKTFPKSLRTHKWRMQDFQIFQLLHNGYAAVVYQALCPLMNEIVALKVYSVNKLDAMTKYQLTRELNIHTNLQHRHIISVYAVFQDNNHIVLVQEFAAAGDLKTIVRRHNGRLAERLVVEKVLEPLLQAVHYLHNNNILHRDIKHKNILFTEEGVLKLADFGIAINLTEEKAVSNVGTHGFMAPEVLKCPPKQIPQENKSKEHLHYNFSADCWSIGVLCYQLLCGSSPVDPSEGGRDNPKSRMKLKLEFPEDISELAEDFIRQSLQSNPEDRPNISTMLHHPWVSRHKARVSLDQLKVSKESLAAEYASIKRNDSMDDCVPATNANQIFANSAKALGRSLADFEPVTIHGTGKEHWSAVYQGFMSGELRPKKRGPNAGKEIALPPLLIHRDGQAQPNPQQQPKHTGVQLKPQTLLKDSQARPDASTGIRLQPRPAAVPLPMRTAVPQGLR